MISLRVIHVISFSHGDGDVKMIMSTRGLYKLDKKTYTLKYVFSCEFKLSKLKISIIEQEFPYLIPGSRPP
jgi:hypothetical protein